MNVYNFYTYTANYTNIWLSKDEVDRLSKGLKYNLPNKNVLIWKLINTEAVIKYIRNKDSRYEIHSIINSKLNTLLKINNFLLNNLLKITQGTKKNSKSQKILNKNLIGVRP